MRTRCELPPNPPHRLKADQDRRLQALDEFLATYEAEHGPITEQEMEEAARAARGRAVVVSGAAQPKRPAARRPRWPGERSARHGLGSDLGSK